MLSYLVTIALLRKGSSPGIVAKELVCELEVMEFELGLLRSLYESLELSYPPIHGWNSITPVLQQG